MHPLFHKVLHDFFIRGLDPDQIARAHHTTWVEVVEILNSEPAIKTMRAAIRAKRMRAISHELDARQDALISLQVNLQPLDTAPASVEATRRAADAVLRGTRPKAARKTAKPAKPVTPPSPQLQTPPPAANRPNPHSSASPPPTRAPSADPPSNTSPRVAPPPGLPITPTYARPPTHSSAPLPAGSANTGSASAIKNSS
ncbi:MAG: hypothetical protein JSS51_12510 [Planctomycetes bacterium]|nr:hypothetical protein [Planctomycetota bacterium]